MKNCKQEDYSFQSRENVTIISVESCIERAKLGNLGSEVPITVNLERDYSLVVSKNQC